MESHSCIENRGEGVPGALPMPNPAIGALPNRQRRVSLRCRHIDALGRRCRMFVATPEITSGDTPEIFKTKRPSFAPITPSASCAAAVPPKPPPLSCSLRFQTSRSTSVNRFLGNLIKFVASNAFLGKCGRPGLYLSAHLNSQAAQDRRELMRLRIAELDAQHQKNLPPASSGIFPCKNRRRAGSPGSNCRKS